MQIWNTKNNSQLQEISFDYAVGAQCAHFTVACSDLHPHSQVLALRMNMRRLVVVLESRLHIHDLQV